jgi:hypothetical protein
LHYDFRLEVNGVLGDGIDLMKTVQKAQAVF